MPFRNRTITINNNSAGGIGFLGALTMALIVLKLVGVINWSWWWVWAPIGLPFVFIVLFLAFYLIILGGALIGFKGKK